MQKAGATSTQHAAPFFSHSASASSSTFSRPRPATSSGDRDASSPATQYSAQVIPRLPPAPTVSVFEQGKERPRVLTKERKPSLSRRSSFTRKRSNSFASISNGPVSRVVTDSATPPALPDFALSAAPKTSRDSDVVQSPASADSFSIMLTRTAPTPVNGYSAASSGASISGTAQATEAAIVHAHIQETANKRMSTLDYLRKAHEGRVYWFNTLLFTQNDLTRLPSFATARIARRATNYLLLGLSLPAVIDFNSSTPLEYLRALNTLLTEFDAFQALHSDGSASTGGLTRARLPQMFRRVPGGKARRTSGQASDIGLPMGASTTNLVSGSTDAYSIGGQSVGVAGGAAGEGAAVISFGAVESELLPGEEYTFLLTPSLPFEPDFFETFATLCDVLIDAYSKLMMLLPTPKDCSAPVAELFSKADAKVRKIIVQGCVKEFEESSRAGVRTEVASVGKVVLGGLL